jgi:hypothetical protein
MAGYKVDELYRKVEKCKARIDVYITDQGYEVTVIFLHNPGAKQLINSLIASKTK